MNFEDWCDRHASIINGHHLNILSSSKHHFPRACASIASVLPTHYASPDQLAHILATLGNMAAAEYLRTKFPQSPQARSGDLGEVLATEYIHGFTNYHPPIKRLRWKDHREMPLRGDDIIAIHRPKTDSPIHFLKAEAKSRQQLSTSALQDAREALNANSGLPSPHALTYIAARLHETDDQSTADQIIRAQLADRIRVTHVQHLLFALTGSRPHNLLETDLKQYQGRIPQISVGLHVSNHRALVASVYAKAQETNDP